MILLVSQMMLWPKFRGFVTFFFWGFLSSYKILIFFSYMFVCRGLLWWFVDKWKERHGRGMWGEGEEDDDDGVCGLPKAKEITTFKSFSLWTNQTSKIVCQVCFPIWSHNCTLFLGACIFFPLTVKSFGLILSCILLCSHHAEMADSKARAELLDIILTKVHPFFFQQFYLLIFF